MAAAQAFKDAWRVEQTFGRWKVGRQSKRKQQGSSGVKSQEEDSIAEEEAPPLPEPLAFKARPGPHRPAHKTLLSSRNRARSSVREENRDQPTTSTLVSGHQPLDVRAGCGDKSSLKVFERQHRIVGSAFWECVCHELL